MGENDLEIPTVHLNGTSGKELLKQMEVVGRAAHGLLTALYDAAPNGRDYYVKGPDALKRAMAQHQHRVKRIASVLEELDCIAEGIAEQMP